MILEDSLNTFMTSILSFYNDVPSKQFIQSTESTTLWMIHKQDLGTLCNKHPEIERWFRAVTAQHLTRLQERIMALQFYTAKERYDLLQEKNPEVLQKAQVSHIASYLGISLETLSRIRATWSFNISQTFHGRAAIALDLLPKQ